MNDTERNLVHRSHQEGMVEGNFAIIDTIYAEDFVNHSLGLPEFARYGPEGLRQQYAFLRSAFSDMEIVSDLETVEDDMIGLRWTWRARHTGEFLGIPPTGAQVQIDGYDILRVKDGLVREVWIVQDGAGLMAQLQAALGG